MKQFDFLVIGGGIAGLTFALEAAKAGTVAVLFKKSPRRSSTSWAQGGIAAVTTANDSTELHIRDTLTAGAGLCDEAVVRLVVEEGPARVAQLVERGVEFDREGASHEYHLHKEGGHSRRRIFHAADATGYEIQTKLLKAAHDSDRITLFEQASAIDLITTHKLTPQKVGQNEVLGAYVLTESGSIERFLASKTLMATGGAGKVYLYTSNPDVATGDGIAMGFRAGARVANMEFFQFHPTCLYNPDAKSFLITEAMRGEGAVLTRIDGTRFMPDYHPQAELAPRDIVARAIDHELKVHGDDYVLLDIRHRGPEFIKSHFPTIHSNCLNYGLDITTEPIPVVPAAHFCCGGILTDQDGLTDLKNLYAAGECAYTGLHGANRLASNSLLEGVVFGHRAAVHACANLQPLPEVVVPEWNATGVTHADEQVTISQCWDEIRTFMWNYVGIVRSNKRLSRALRRSGILEAEIQEYYWNFHVIPDLLELRNISLVSSLIIRSALARHESRGLHYNLDWPETLEDPQPTILDPVSARTG
jgi:L-aspartate oxidase